MSLPLLKRVDCVDASPAIFERISPLLLSEALISTRSQPRSCSSASLTVVFPTPAGPYSRAARLVGLPSDHQSIHSLSFSIAVLLPATSLLVPGRYLTVQGSTVKSCDRARLQRRVWRAVRCAALLHLRLVRVGSRSLPLPRRGRSSSSQEQR